jgi:hypothetical protein
VPVVDGGGSEGCETSRLPPCLDNRFADDGKALAFSTGHPPPPPGGLMVLFFARVAQTPLVPRPSISLLYQHWKTDEKDCQATGGMNESQGNRSTQRKPAPVPLWPPQTTHMTCPGLDPGSPW